MNKNSEAFEKERLAGANTQSFNEKNERPRQEEKTSFDFDEIMNKGKILLVKLGKGRFGATVSALLANQIVTRFKLAAMKRGDMPHEDRRDFFLYVDECHNLPS